MNDCFVIRHCFVEFTPSQADSLNMNLAGCEDISTNHCRFVYGSVMIHYSSRSYDVDSLSGPIMFFGSPNWPICSHVEQNSWRENLIGCQSFSIGFSRKSLWKLEFCGNPSESPKVLKKHPVKFLAFCKNTVNALGFWWEPIEIPKCLHKNPVKTIGFCKNSVKTQGFKILGSWWKLSETIGFSCKPLWKKLGFWRETLGKP